MGDSRRERVTSPVPLAMAACPVRRVTKSRSRHATRSPVASQTVEMASGLNGRHGLPAPLRVVVESDSEDEGSESWRTTVAASLWERTGRLHSAMWAFIAPGRWTASSQSGAPGAPAVPAAMGSAIAPAWFEFMEGPMAGGARAACEKRHRAIRPSAPRCRRAVVRAARKTACLVRGRPGKSAAQLATAVSMREAEKLFNMPRTADYHARATSSRSPNVPDMNAVAPHPKIAFLVTGRTGGPVASAVDRERGFAASGNIRQLEAKSASSRTPRRPASAREVVTHSISVDGQRGASGAPVQRLAAKGTDSGEGTFSCRTTRMLF
mmetsp:Transcript_71719/g.171322  ORF Transcript_71719/g.171322 Transcript_71719/m.171322 type:complete len:323 (+) Transcript_71719:3472-4440(+)